MGDKTSRSEAPVAGSDRLNDVIAGLEAARLHIELLDPELGKRIWQLVQEAGQPGVTVQPEWPARVAHALAETEILTGPLAIPPEARAALTGAAGPETPTQAGETPRLSPGTEGATAPLKPADVKEIARQLEMAATHIELINPSLAQTIRHAAQQAGAPNRQDQPGVRIQLGYAFVEAEKAVGPLAVAPAMRAELLRLATSLPGLRNDRARDLLEATPRIADTNLARDIRKVAAEIAPKADQHDADTESRLDVLENRLRTAPRTEAAENRSPATSSPASSPGSRPPRGAQRAAAGPHGPATTLDPNLRRPLPQQARMPEGPANQVAYGPAGTLIGLFSAIKALGTRPNSGRPLPWDGPPDSLAERHRTFEREIMAPRRQDQSLQAAEQSGRAALEALRAFTNGPGAAILTRIDDAAKATQGGLPEVLAQMRDGGRLADLRQEFNGTLAAEKGFAAAYDTATNALAQYGGQRAAIAPLLAGKANAATALGKFERLDAELGQAAMGLPGRADGKSAFDEIGEKTREIIQVAVDAVRSAFVRGASAQTTKSPMVAPDSCP